MPVEELGIEFFTTGFAEMNRNLSSIDDKLGALATQSEKTGGILETGLGVALGGVLVKAAEAATSALTTVAETAATAFADSFTMAVDFESSLSRLAIAASSTGLSFEELSAAAIAVGGDSSLLGVSASSAAEAMEGLFKAGLSNTEVFGDLQGYLAGTAELSGALRAAIDLAASSELDMVQASDLAAVALATFGGELDTEEERAQFITAAMDNLVKSADASVTSVSGLGEALSFVGPTASQAGLSFQDTTNALALLSGAGIEGSRAGTTLEAMLRSLIAPTDQAQGEFKKLGIELFDQEGQFKDLSEIIGDFEGALAGMTDEQRAASLGTIFTAQGMRSMNVLLAEGADGWNEMATATENAAGIQVQAAAKSATFAGKMEAFQGVIETLQITLGTQFLPVAGELLTWVTSLAETYGPPLISLIEGAVDEFTSLSSAMGRDFPWEDIMPEWMADVMYELLDSLDLLASFWTDNGPAIMKIAQETFASVMESIGELSKEVLPFVVEQFTKWVNYMVDNGPKIVTVLGGIGKAVALAADVIVNMWKIAEPIFGALVDVIIGMNEVVLNVLTGNWQGVWDSAVKIVEAAWRGIQDSFLALATWVTSWFGTSWTEVVAQWARNWDMFQEIVELVWQRITEAIDAAFLSIAQFIEAQLATISQFFTDTWDDITDGIDDFAKSVEKAWDDLWGGVEKETNSAGDTLSKTIDGWITGIFTKMGLDLDTMVSRWSAIWENIVLIADTVWARIMETIDTWLTRARTFIQQQMEEVQSFWNSTWNAIADFVETTWSAISDTISGFMTTILSAVTDLVNQISAKAREIYDNVTGSIAAIGEWIGKKAGEFAGWGKKIIESIMSGIGNLIENNPFIEAIGGAIDGLKAWITDSVDLLAKLVGIGKAIIDGILAGLAANVGRLINYLTKIIEDLIASILGQLGIPDIVPDPAGFAGSSGVAAVRGGGSSSTTNIYQETNQFNLTTNSSMQPGGLQMEFDTMALLRTR